jgi:hypothetical protein
MWQARATRTVMDPMQHEADMVERRTGKVIVCAARTFYARAQKLRRTRRA